MVESMIFNYDTQSIGRSLIVHADCFEWLSRLPENSLHAIVTDPPYGVKEYEAEQLEKRANGNGGIWRLPPSFDSCIRSPLPRFTALNPKERRAISDFFFEWGKQAYRVLRPGAHVFIATNSFMANVLYSAIVESGFEFRGQVIRLVRTLRGGDRPKNAEEEFSDVSSLPRGCYEPWGLFRKPLLPGMRVSDCLREFQTGGLRRISKDKPFEDIVQSERTPKTERDIADHPSLKPQSLMRRLVYASLPLGKGIVCDPFMGAGSTIAAAGALGVNAVGVERNQKYFELANCSIGQLMDLPCPEVDNLLGRRSIESKQLPLVMAF